MFGWRWSTNFLMAKKNSVSSFVKIIFATIIWRLRKIWFSQHTQMQPEVATRCFVPDKCGVAWGVSHQRHGNGFHFWKGFLACSLSLLIWIETVRERKLGFNCELPNSLPHTQIRQQKKNLTRKNAFYGQVFCTVVTKRFGVVQKHLVFCSQPQNKRSHDGPKEFSFARREDRLRSTSFFTALHQRRSGRYKHLFFRFSTLKFKKVKVAF